MNINFSYIISLKVFLYFIFYSTFICIHLEMYIQMYIYICKTINVYATFKQENPRFMWMSDCVLGYPYSKIGISRLWIYTSWYHDCMYIICFCFKTLQSVLE